MTLLGSVAGATLLHGLWQGGLILAVWAVARRGLRHSAPGPRYALDLAVLALLAVTPALTGAIYYLTFDPTGFVPAASLPGRAGLRAPVAVPAGLTLQVWLAGAGLGSVVLLAGWHHLRWLVRGAAPVRVPLACRDAVGLVPGLRLLESHRVASPAAAGLWRPVVILPAGLADDLTETEFRAVLLHEIAHLRRADYAINLVQRLVEIALWFHPAVWIVSRAARRERELCCDLEAAARCGRPLVLARGLLRLEELRSASPTLAIGANAGDVTDRIRRLLHPAIRPVPLGFRLALPALIGGGALASLGGGALAVGDSMAATLPVVTVQAVDPAGRFTFEMVAGRARAVSVEGIPVPARRVRQRRGMVEVLDAGGRTALRLHLVGATGITWTPRSQSP